MCVYNVCMPRKNVWIRDDDLPTWKAIENKSQWIHEALRGTDPETYNPAAKERAEIRELVDKSLKLPDEGWEGPLFRDGKKGKL